MDCRNCSEDLTAFLDGEVSPAESERIQSHLRTCASCTEELRSLREAAEFIESHGRDLALRPGSWHLVRARIQEIQAVPASPIPIFNRFRWAMAVTAVVAILAFGYTQYQQIQKRDLDRYISHYVQQRESQITRALTAEDPYGGNPFMEVNVRVPENPFRSEGR